MNDPLWAKFAPLTPNLSEAPFYTETSQYPHASLVLSILIPVLIFIVIGVLMMISAKIDSSRSLAKKTNLQLLPISAKALITITLVSFCLVHVFAILTVILKTMIFHPSTNDYFFYMTLEKLSALSHAHFFGHGAMYVLTAAPFLFIKLGERAKRIILLLAPSGAILDNASWWGIKFVSEKFEIISYFSGAMITIGFALMTTLTLCQLWKTARPDTVPSPA